MKSVATKAKSIATIDWLTFTVRMQENPQAVITEWLRMDAQLFTLQTWGKFGYTQSMYFDGIYVFFGAPEGQKMQMGVCVSMSGKGCRTFERFTSWQSNKFTPFMPFFQAAHINEDVHFTRVDLALDDRDKLLDLDKIIDCVDTDCINSRIRSRTYYRTYDGAGRAGTTVYIGAPASDFRIRFYDKAKEHYKPSDAEYFMHWVRCEIVMRGKNADGCIAALCNTENLGYLACAILKDKLLFIERDDSNISRCTVCSWWSDFCGAVAGIKLVTKEDVPHTLERSLEWVITQVAPTLSIINDAMGFFELRHILQIGTENRSDKQDALLKDYLKSRIA